MDKIDEYIDMALKSGALHAVKFTRSDIVYDERTLLKCAFGCKDYGLMHTCPSAPNFLGLDLYKKIFQKYEYGLIIHCDCQQVSQNISFAIESRAFCEGYYWAFSLSDCCLCKTCLGKLGKACANKDKARPAFHSVGIDVYKTVNNFGLPLKTLKDESEPQNWYSAVFIE